MDTLLVLGLGVLVVLIFAKYHLIGKSAERKRRP
jgi:hypothetical protein